MTEPGWTVENYRSFADPDCTICKGTNCLALDVLQVSAARARWQWDDRLGAGANYCPCSHPIARQQKDNT